MFRILAAVIALATLAGYPSLASAEVLKQIEQEGIERTEEGQAAQQRIDEVSDRSRELLDAYRAELKLVEGLETYVEMLDRQLEGQRREVETLKASIGDVAVIERQILPLMSRMIDTLEEFVRLDLPFLLEERTRRVEKLRGLLGRSDVTVAEKCRRVFEAYQIETEYGRTIEAYKGKLVLGEGTFDADFLRIGRTALLYQTVGGEQLGYWDIPSGGWQPLEAVPYRRLLEKGLKVARQEVAPELITIPLNLQQVEAL
jgi:predicted RNase H-like nuclease (RuvC/YqgF family)